VETKITPAEHTRGATFELTGWVWRNGSLMDLTPATVKLYFNICVINSDGSLTPSANHARATGSADLTQGATGVYTVSLAPEYTKRGGTYALTDDTVWVQVDVVDETTNPDKRWPVCRMPLTLMPGANE